MRKIAALLLSCLLFGCMSITAFAKEAVITTSVPNSHTVTVSADGADVFFAGEAVSQFEAERLSEPQILIRADSGKTVKQVLLNGKDITAQIKGGYYTFAPVCEDKTLTVVAEDEAAVPHSKTYTVKGTVMRNGEPVQGITFELRSTLSTLKTAVAGKDGKFCFSDVACGKHSLTALENGKIVGYVEFVLTEGTVADFNLTDSGVYNITANRDETGIDLTLNLGDDGMMKIENISGVQGGKPSDAPQTGDTSNLALWIALLFVGGGAVIGITVVSRKKKRSR